MAQGLLLRRRGLGTTVANRQIHRKAELTSLFDDLKREGASSPSTTVLVHEIVEDERAATAMGLPPDTPLLSVVRLRKAGDLPLAVMHNWLPPAYSDISREELEKDGLYAVLRDRGVRPVVAHQTIGARTPTPAERRHLELRAVAARADHDPQCLRRRGQPGGVRRPLLPGAGLHDRGHDRPAVTITHPDWTCAGGF